MARVIWLIGIVSAAVALLNDGSTGNDLVRTPCRSSAVRTAAQKAEGVAEERLGLERKGVGEPRCDSPFDWMDQVSWDEDPAATPSLWSLWRPGDASAESRFSPSVVVMPTDDAIRGDVGLFHIATMDDRRWASCSPPRVVIPPVFCEDAAGCPPSSSWEEPVDVSRTVVVGLPAVIGVFLFFGHAARQWMRWRLAVDRARRASCGEEEVATLEDRTAQPSLVFSLVEREARRAAQRAKLYASRRPALLPSDEFGRDRKSVIPLPASFVVGGDRLRRAT